MEKKFMGFIGTGNMGGALARAAVKNVAPEEILLSNRHPEKADALGKELGCTVTPVETVAGSCKYIFLGVKPQMMGDLMKQIVPVLRQRNDRFILVSMAAGLTMERIQTLANGDYPVLRICPNTPVGIGKGMTMWCSHDVTKAEEQEFLNAMAWAGEWDYCPENLMDAAMVVGGASPAFTYLFIEAMADGAVRCGLPRQKALLYACRAVEGAAALAGQMKEHPGALKDAVCSPGGSTIVGINALEEHAFRAGVMDAVYASCQRNKEMGK